MKLVQVGILLALVAVAALLGLNLLRDSSPVTTPAESASAAVGQPMEGEAFIPDAAKTTAPATNAPTVVAHDSAPIRETTVAPAPAKVERPANTKPERTSATQTSAKPAPSAPRPAPTTQAANTVPPANRPIAVEDIQVDGPPPPAPSADATTATAPPQYELMRPQQNTPPASTTARTSTPAVAPPRTVTIPAGTIVTVRTGQRLSSETSKVGDTFVATLDQPLVYDDLVIAEKGARVEGAITQIAESGRVKGVAAISVQLVKLNTSDGQTVPVRTQSFTLDAESSKKGDAAKVGIATGVGAALGAIFGGGKGAAIGAGAGAGVGAGTVLATKGKPAEIAAETRINFRLDQPLNLTEKINE